MIKIKIWGIIRSLFDLQMNEIPSSQHQVGSFDQQCLEMLSLMVQRSWMGPYWTSQPEKNKKNYKMFTSSRFCHHYWSPCTINSWDHHRDETSQEYHSSKYPGVLRIPGEKKWFQICFSVIYLQLNNMSIWNMGPDYCRYSHQSRDY